MKRLSFRKIGMILVALLAVVAIFASVCLTACSDDIGRIDSTSSVDREEQGSSSSGIQTSGGDTSSSSDGKEENGSASPSTELLIYQGMVISSTTTKTTTYSADNVTGDLVGKEDWIDDDRPFGDDSATLEQQLEQEFKVVGGGQDIYYADLNEEIYITVKFYNPNNYEILSFVINGKTYTSYMFESGSDMENIIIKLNVGSVAGINEYEISEIKYVDGSEIKYATMNGEAYVRCGVRGDEDVRASVSDERVGLDSISFTARVVDVYSLVEESDGFVKAVLYDGTDILEMVDLEVGNNEVEFGGLYPNTLYQYAIVAEYDDLSGNGVGLFYLYKNTVYTEAQVLFDNVVVTKTGVSFDFVWYEGYDDSYLHTKFTLEGGSRLFEEIEPTTEITGLLSNHEYTLNVAYTGIYEETEAIRLTFKTLAMEMPEVDIRIFDVTQNSMSYAVAVTDPDETGEISSMALYLKNAKIDSADEIEGTFENLLSGNEYTFTVVYEYDLNDGAGAQTLEASESVTTSAKAVPDVEIDSLTAGKRDVGYELSVTDQDGVGRISSVTLSLDGEEDIEGNATLTGSFDNLLSDREYTLTVVYAYDLNDGVGERELVVSQCVVTFAMIAPVAEIALIDATSDEITFSVTFADEDSIGTMTSIGLYAADGTLASEDASTYTGEMTYSNLSSHSQYTLIVSYKYNLNDGAGYRYEFVELSAYTEPVIEFTSIEVLNTSAVIEGEEITLRISIYNPDGAVFTSAVINGEIYEVSKISSSSSLYIDILDEGQFDGGHTEFVITQIVGTMDGRDYTLDVCENNIASAFINGELTVEGFSLVSIEDGVEEERLYRFKGENLYYKISLINATGYEIESVTIGSTEYSGNQIYVTSDKQAVYVEMPSDSSNGWHTASLSSISYSNKSVASDNNKLVDKSKSVGVSTTYVRLSITSEDIVEISTAEDLMTVDMTGWKYYRLTNDIDLFGYEWINMNNSLQGVFDGDGHIISNVMGVTTCTDNNLYLGLFYNVEGVVMDLEVADVLYIVTLKNESTSDAYSVYAGGLAAKSSRMILSNCRVNSSVQITNETGGTVYVGALSGSGASNSELYSVSSSLIGKVTSIKYSSNGYFGSGSISSSKAVDSRCECDITISTTSSSSVEINEGYVQDGEFLFSVNDGDYELIEYLGSDKSVTLPSSIDGHSYSIGDEAFYSNKNIKEVIISDGVTGIGYQAFYGCTALTSVTIRSTVTIIGEGAFRGCTSLTSITIPEGVTSIGEYAFYNCTSLMEINFNAINMDDLPSGNYVFYKAGQDGYGITVIIGENVKAIPAYLFYPASIVSYYPNVTSVVFEDGCACEKIGSYAFSGCTSLTGVYIYSIESWCGINFASSSSNPLQYAGNLYLNGRLVADLTISSDVTVIGSYAFYGCTSLTSVIIGESVDEIGSYTFGYCTSLTSVVIGANVTGIGNYAFEYCSSLVDICYNAVYADDFSSNKSVFYYAGSSNDELIVTIGANVESIPAYLFYNSNITSVIFEDGSKCSRIGSYAFSNCSSLMGVYITSIEMWCGISFGNSTSNPLYYAGDLYLNNRIVTELSITGDVTAIGAYVFSYCTSLTSVTIGASVTSIGNYAFEYCTSLTSVTIGASVTSIGNYAFGYCSSLTDIRYNAIKANDLSSNKSVFYYAGSSNDELVVTIGANVESIPAYLFYGSSITGVKFEDGSRCSSIGNYAFGSCSSLADITIPSSITSIGNYAFSGCSSLTSIIIPENVTSIGEYVLNNCTSLKEIYYYASNFSNPSNNYVFRGAGSGSATTVVIGANVTKIPSYLFYYSNITELIFEDGSKCTTIENYAFYGCTYLESIVIPTEVTSIGTYSFYNCTSLIEVYFNATGMSDLSSYNDVFYNAGINGAGITVTIGANVTKIPAYLFNPYPNSSYSPRIVCIVFEDGSICSSIGSYAFGYCGSLTSIVIPASMTSISSNAFYNCTGLSSVYYQGTSDGWSKISINSTNNSYFTNAMRYYYSESAPTTSGNWWHYDESGEIVVWGKED